MLKLGSILQISVNTSDISVLLNIPPETTDKINFLYINSERNKIYEDLIILYTYSHCLGSLFFLSDLTASYASLDEAFLSTWE